MPPISCTSKWRIPKTRLLASRTVAKASGKIWSKRSPSFRRFRNSVVFSFSSASLNASNSGSSELIRSTSFFMVFRMRSLRLPNTFRNRLPSMRLIYPVLLSWTTKAVPKYRLRSKLIYRVILSQLCDTQIGSGQFDDHYAKLRNERAGR